MVGVSIIVPIYNMAELMRGCINSLLEQEFKNIEILLIDDGSTDNSWNICQAYAVLDSRIKIFHKSNGGLSSARNYGLRNAKGKYSIFVDPDDFIDKEGLEHLYNSAEKNDADMVICDIFIDSYKGQYVLKQSPSSGLSATEVLEDIALGRLHGFTVNKLIKTRLYKDLNVYYPENIYGIEDEITIAEICTFPIKICYEPIAFYHYVQYDKSLSRKYNEKTFEIDLLIIRMYREMLINYTFADKVDQRLKYRALAHAFSTGGDYYSSALFYERFKTWEETLEGIKDELVFKTLIRLSCRGYYHFAFKTYKSILYLKRLFYSNKK